MVTIEEGGEPDEFWNALGGKKKYDHEAEFMNYTRLFRCTNEKGYFSVSEKTVDFCQVCKNLIKLCKKKLKDDLENEDVMIVDSGEFVFLWLGEFFL